MVHDVDMQGGWPYQLLVHISAEYFMEQLVSTFMEDFHHAEM